MIDYYKKYLKYKLKYFELKKQYGGLPLSQVAYDTISAYMYEVCYLFEYSQRSGCYNNYELFKRLNDEKLKNNNKCPQPDVYKPVTHINDLFNPVLQIIETKTETEILTMHHLNKVIIIFNAKFQDYNKREKKPIVKTIIEHLNDINNYLEKYLNENKSNITDGAAQKRIALKNGKIIMNQMIQLKTFIDTELQKNKTIEKERLKLLKKKD